MKKLVKRKAKTPKEKAFLKEYADTLNATEAAMRVYNCKDRDSARALGCATLAKLSLSDSLAAEGVTDHYLAKKTKEGTEANKVISARVIVKKDKPTSMAGELPLANSRTDDFVEIPDYAVRHKYLETALRLKGHGEKTTVGVRTDGKTIEFIFQTSE